MQKHKIDPQPGERWRHKDGWPMYVIGRTSDAVALSFLSKVKLGYSAATGYIPLSTFKRFMTGRWTGPFEDLTSSDYNRSVGG